MRIGIDASGLGGPKTGTAVYLTELLAVWNRGPADHEFVIFANEHAKGHLAGLGLDRRFRLRAAPARRGRRVVWQQAALPALLAGMKVDVHWGAGFVLPLLSTRRMVLTVHDLTFHLFPEVHERIKRYYFPAIIEASVKKARAVIAISESTRQDLHRLIPASVGKTTVTLLAARSAQGMPPAPAATSEDYFLFVGTVEPRKNLARLLGAWNLLEPRVRGSTQLWVVGAAGWMVTQLLERLAAAETVRFLGKVGDDELFRVIRNAKAFVYPSLYEGFGLPVVEAMSVGVPVLTSNVGATREVAEGAAILVDPTSEADIRAGLERLLLEPQLRQSLASLGRARAAEFTWDRAARQTLEVIERQVDS